MGRKLESGVPQLTSPGHITVNGPGYAGYWDSFGRWHGIGGGRIPDSTRQQAENILRMQQPVDPYAEIMERMSEAMAQQAAMQAEYMNQMALLQEEQLRMQEEAAKAAMIENKKNPSDYSQANADDTARKQLLRRGLMSTFTRYGNANDGGGGKATKLGG